MANGTIGFLSAKVFAEDRAPHLMEEFTEAVFSMETKSRFLVIKIMICLETANCAALVRDGIPAYQSVRLVAGFSGDLCTAFMTKA